MSKRCQLSGRTPKKGRTYTIRGIAKKKKGIGLKITGKTKRRFYPNIQKKRIYLPEEKRWVTLSLSASAMRTMDKIGTQAAVRQMRANGERI